MHIKTLQPEIKSLNYLIVAYDISKYKHNFYTHFTIDSESMESEGEIKSPMKSVISHFEDLVKLKETYNFHGVQIVCEPTGGYEKALLRKAREFGFLTQYVSGEATNKAKVIESNDSGKNDQKDARVIHMLAAQGKTLSCTESHDHYGELKFYNRKYEDLSLEAARRKNRINSLVEELFPDISITARQLYNKTMQCVIDTYKLNPYVIANLEWEVFLDVITACYGRKLSKVAAALLERVWRASLSSRLNIMPDWKSNALAEELENSYRLWTAIEDRKKAYKDKMITLVEKTEEWQQVNKAPVSAFMFSRILAESGSWKAYPGIRQLMRYAGLNLREKQSGTYQGQVRLSKKGNSLMRKCLGQMVFSCLVKKKRLYGDFYRQKKEKRNGFYALTCVMRKALRMLFGTYQSGAGYQGQRVFDQTFETNKAAA